MREAFAYTLFDNPHIPVFPSTRYQGCKVKFIDWIWDAIKDLPFQTALDAFGGTGCVAYKMKQEGKTVTYNDILPFNSIIGKALIENTDQSLSDEEIDQLLVYQPGIIYPDFIQKTFSDIYFTDEENRWLDMVSTNIRMMNNPYKQAIAYFALFQSCIIKRPYNLFHRRNLYVRMQDVQQSFGNKVTWDTPFPVHFKRFVTEANNAVFDNGKYCRSCNSDALSITDSYDLVYIDTPYINAKGVGLDYSDFYHFLNGILSYPQWADLIDYKSKNLRLKRVKNTWCDKNKIADSFKRLFRKFNQSILVISYRSNGIPSIEDIYNILRSEGRQVTIMMSKEIKYALSNSGNKEVLIIATI